jgi:hypothetical protein
MRIPPKIGLLLMPLLLLAGHGRAATNLVTDPGFESCTLGVGVTPPGWTASFANASCQLNPHTGRWDNDFISAPSTLSQAITTIAGDNYDFSFWLWPTAAMPNSFTAAFGSDEVLDLENVGFTAYALHDFTVTATGIVTTISFTGATNGSS